MKITRELIDNGQKIVHINYDKKDLKLAKKRHEEMLKKLEEQKKALEAEIAEKAEAAELEA